MRAPDQLTVPPMGRRIGEYQPIKPTEGCAKTGERSTSCGWGHHPLEADAVQITFRVTIPRGAQKKTTDYAKEAISDLITNSRTEPASSQGGLVNARLESGKPVNCCNSERD
ncbi:hypothetical protein CDAR_497761 [Caerostris darwini]|uniref:Uncharacterized protein n=1 Tax=Caerostris darwini TaxID=1538125 RepID=A0AAV4PPU9_9ARAC|nr:hypothetical protein CDAR_497761 [Caerostris darwini]